MKMVKWKFNNEQGRQIERNEKLVSVIGGKCTQITWPFLPFTMLGWYSLGMFYDGKVNLKIWKFDKLQWKKYMPLRHSTNPHKKKKKKELTSINFGEPLKVLKGYEESTCLFKWFLWKLPKLECKGFYSRDNCESSVETK